MSCSLNIQSFIIYILHLKSNYIFSRHTLNELHNHRTIGKYEKIISEFFKFQYSIKMINIVKLLIIT